MRGWAALMVLLSHAISGVFGIDVFVLRFPTDGVLAVFIFFTISGFALAIGFVTRRDPEIIESQALRRYFRLTIPILAISLIAYWIMAAGLMYAQPLAAVLPPGNWITNNYRFSGSLREAVSFGLHGVYFRWDFATTYNSSLWTMQFELAGSFIIFALLTLNFATRLRWSLYAAAAILAARISPVYLCFVFGVCLAELHASGVLDRWRTS